MRTLWISLAGICAIGAIVFLRRQRLDAAFVLGALSVVAWFLNYRVQMKRITAEDDTSQSTNGDDDEDFDH